MRDWTYYNRQYQLYAYTKRITWNYSQYRRYKGDTVVEDRRMYLHLYFSPDRALEEEKAFNNRLVEWQEELESGKPCPEHEKFYTKYFKVKTTPVRGTKVIAKKEAIANAKRYYGYFALVGNEAIEAIEALEIYRNKDMVEKAFENLKERLNTRRLAVSSEQSLNGKLFVQFIALIFLSFIIRRMQEKKMFKAHTLQEVLDELDVIECFQTPGRKIQVGEQTKRQSKLYEDLGVPPPTSLQ